ncbi:TetR/AcrR family transcriptional regulator [Nocardioides panacihumi]|uniref:TetR/AcrR family transcriptional regulator n=2 Tax=Nocardioides panacihumi TaxID=400774 RepID=A0ABN2RJW7_9ACTN
MVDVKRSYDSSRRQEQARRNRDAVLNAAERRFLADGYGVTTITAIASEAGVSAETVYKRFGGKAGLVTAIWERGLAGRGPVPAPQRSDEMQAREEDPRQIIRNWGQLTAEVAPRVAPILLLVRAAAATDPEMARLLADADRQRLRRMRHNAEALTDHLRTGMSPGEAAEIMWTYSSPDLYDLLVVRRRWTLPRYSRFISEAMINALLR